MKKRIFILAAALAIIGLVVAGGFYAYHSIRWSMDYVIQHDPTFYGIVKEISAEKDKILIELDRDFVLERVPYSRAFRDLIYDSHASVWVSLDTKFSDGSFDGRVGDEVYVHYDGNVTDGEPGEVTTVYFILVARSDTPPYP